MGAKCTIDTYHRGAISALQNAVVPYTITKWRAQRVTKIILHFDGSNNIFVNIFLYWQKYYW